MFKAWYLKPIKTTRSILALNIMISGAEQLSSFLVSRWSSGSPCCQLTVVQQALKAALQTLARLAVNSREGFWNHNGFLIDCFPEVCWQKKI